MWIVTKELNAYDQYGEYFVCVYAQKPTFSQLKNSLGLSDVTTGKLTRGGGREDCEDEWYSLHKIKSGVVFQE